MKLRPYQARTVAEVEAHQGGPLAVELATAAGKSHIIAQLCKNLPPGAHALVVTHTKDIVAQNAEKLYAAFDHDPDAPIAVYSAGLKSREVARITVAGIQSIHKSPEIFGRIDLLIIDECHTVSHKGVGMYNNLIAALHRANPAIRIVGFTATPYRMGGGYLHQKRDDDDTGRIFTDLLQPVTITELIADGYLAPLRSKHTAEQMDTSQLKVKGYDFSEADIFATTTDAGNARMVKETIALAGNRGHWLFFCAGIQHCENLAKAFNDAGVTAAALHSKLDMADRNRRMAAHRAGHMTCLTNANILTTGYDDPNIGLIGFARPTLSPGLYVQMAGRGMRLKDDGGDCLVLDYAGLVRTHGPITHLEPPKVRGKRRGVVPTKLCPGVVDRDGVKGECAEIVHLSVMTCPACGYKWPKREKGNDMELDPDADIMGESKTDASEVVSWKWEPYVRKDEGKGIKVAYTCRATASGKTRLLQWLPVNDEGDKGRRAADKAKHLLRRAGLSYLVDSATPEAEATTEIPALCDMVNEFGRAPSVVYYAKKGRQEFVFSQKWGSIGAAVP